MTAAHADHDGARDRAEQAEAREAKLLEQIAYVEGVLSREPFGKAEQDLAARILRAALSEGEG